MSALQSLARTIPAAVPEGPLCVADLTGPLDTVGYFAFSEALSGAPTLAEGLQGALETLAASGGWPVALYLTTAPDDGFCLAAAAGLPFEQMTPPHDLLERCLAAKRFLQATTDLVGRPSGCGSLVGLPLKHDGSHLGVLLVLLERAPAAPLLRSLRAAAVLLSYALTAGDLRAALARQEGLDNELELAAEIQRGLLPDSDLSHCPVFGLNRPVRQVSGDFYDFFWLGDDRVAFALGDVSGKGINAALLMAKTAGLFRCLAKSIADPAEVLRLINRELCETASRGMFVTMVAGVYHQATGQVHYANAGHEPLLLRTAERSYSSFPAESPPLGIDPAFSPASQEMSLAGGELYLFSDGLTEFGYGAEEALGVQGLVQLIEGLAELPLDARVVALLSELDHEGWEARDDLTVLAIDDSWVRR